MPRSRLLRGLRVVVLMTGAGVLTLAVLYQFFGLRFRPDGSGLPRLRFVTTLDEQAERVAQHRASQRSSADAPVVTPSAEAPSDLGNIAPADPGPAGADAEGSAAPVEGAESGSSAGASTEITAPAPPGPPGWTDFRGPQRDGVYRGSALAASWPATGLEPLWKQPIGAGYAAFVTAKGRAFTIEQRGPEEVVAAYDIASGRELWTHAWPELFRESMGGDGPRATPTWADGLVYALGAAGELRCLEEVGGRLIWRTNILDDSGAGNLDWGMAASPLVIGDTLIVLPGGPNGQSVVAYDRRTGARLWSAQDDRAGYAAPMLARLAGRDHLVVFSAERLMGLSLDRGELLWSYPWVTNAGINVSQPLVVAENRLFVSSGYGVGAAVIELTPAGAGFTVREVWRNTRMKNKFTSSVVHDGFVYGLDEAILACIDAATGALQWKGGRYGYGQLLLADDRLIVLTEDGELVLVAATPDRHIELASFPAISGKTWNHLAIDAGRLLVRNLNEMAAFDLRRR